MVKERKDQDCQSYVRKTSGGCENWESFWRIYIYHGQDKFKSENGVLGEINSLPKMSMT